MRVWSLVRQVFGVHGFATGIEANPEKVKVILDITSLKSVKEVQRLTGRVAALNRFVSRATNKCFLFF